MRDGTRIIGPYTPAVHTSKLKSVVRPHIGKRLSLLTIGELVRHSKGVCAMATKFTLDQNSNQTLISCSRDNGFSTSQVTGCGGRALVTASFC